MVTEVMTCSIAQGVTIMMNVKDIADIDEEVTTPVQYRKAGKRLAMLYKL